MSTKARIILIILSYLALINVTCIPIYGDGGGLLAEDFQPRFGEVMKNVFQDDEYKERTGDEITVSIFSQ